MSHDEQTYKTTDLTEFGYPPSDKSWRYRLLTAEALKTELARLAHPQSVPEAQADTITIQPCQAASEASQDRLAVRAWEIAGGTWTFAAVFDGHAGEETAELAVQRIPNDLRSRLEKLLASSPSDLPAAVPGVIQDTLTAFDDALAQDLFDIFPGGVEAIDKMSDGEIKALINDSDRGGANITRVLRCMRGSTALIALVDPEKNVWVASLGDCQAVLVSQGADGQLSSIILSSSHNGLDQAEVQRVRDAHPDEDGAVIGFRVLGAIMVTRALGDHAFKLPRIWTDRVFLNAEPGFKVHSKVEEFIARSFTPPYLTATADIRYYAHDSSAGPRYLVLASDGLTDLFSPPAAPPIFTQTHADKWAGALRRAADADAEGNLALAILRAGLGGEDLDKCSKYLTIEKKERMMDDTTIVVHRL